MTSDNPNSTTPPEPSEGSTADPRVRRQLLAFVLPFVVYMVLQTLEPQPVSPAANDASAEASTEEVLADETPEGGDLEGGDFDDGSDNAGAIPGRFYPAMYAVKVVVTLGVVLYFLPVYLQWPLRVSPLAIGVGVVGVVLWIVCARLDPTGQLVEWLGEEHWLTGLIGGGERPAYNPLGVLGPTAGGYAFLALRFFGLAVLVPVVEEAFLRAFLMRYVMHDNWTEIPFGVVNRMAIAAGILVPVVYHPEHLAALVWFSLVTWLMVRTKNFWDCVAAHAVTNLLLGVWVVTTGSWELW